jgi:hypothetical protein
VFDRNCLSQRVAFGKRTGGIGASIRVAGC